MNAFGSHRGAARAECREEFDDSHEHIRDELNPNDRFERRSAVYGPGPASFLRTDYLEAVMRAIRSLQGHLPVVVSSSCSRSLYQHVRATRISSYRQRTVGGLSATLPVDKSQILARGRDRRR